MRLWLKNFCNFPHEKKFRSFWMKNQPKKILYFTKYSRNAGSSRLRSFQYFPFLEQAGLKVEASPLFSEAYVENLYAGKSTKKEAIVGYLKRFVKLWSVFKYDQLVIEKELFPYVPAFAEKLLNLFGFNYIIDYDDAVFHNYDQHGNAVVREVLGNKIDAVMKNASRVVAGNSYLADRAKKAGAKKIEIIPTVIDLTRYAVQEKEAGKLVIGWIGTKTTFEKHLLPQRNWIKKIQEENADIEFHIVGITEDMDLGKNAKYIPWTEDSEVREIQQFDVGIMPLQDSLWEKGKCSYKIIQYFACGIPAIASPVGMNTEVVLPHKNGFLVTTENDWLHAIQTLKVDKELRQAFGQNGRSMVEDHYSIQVTAKKWIEILKN